MHFFEFAGRTQEHPWANPKVSNMTPEHSNQLYPPKCTTYIDDIIFTHYSHLDDGTENEQVFFLILAMKL